MLLPQAVDGRLDLLKTALCLQLSHGSIHLMACATPERLATFVLVVLGHLIADVTGAGVDNDKQIAIFAPVYLNEVVAAAQCANARCARSKFT